VRVKATVLYEIGKPLVIEAIERSCRTSADAALALANPRVGHMLTGWGRLAACA
jgi:hypothetical protein